MTLQADILKTTKSFADSYHYSESDSRKKETDKHFIKYINSVEKDKDKIRRYINIYEAMKI